MAKCMIFQDRMQLLTVKGPRDNLTLNRPGFLQIGMARGGQILSSLLCNFCLNGPIDLKFGT